MYDNKYKLLDNFRTNKHIFAFIAYSLNIIEYQ